MPTELHDPPVAAMPVRTPSAARTAPESAESRHEPPVSGHAFQCGAVGMAGLQPAPLPDGWVRSGQPAPRSVGLTHSADGRMSSALWSCQAGSFTFIFPSDELVHILEGEVVVEAQGQRRHLKAGDVAYFPQDLPSVWTVPHHLKKLAVFRSVPRPWHERVLRLLRRLFNAPQRPPI